MAVYLQAATEVNLHLCVLHGLWATKKNKLASIKQGDVLVIYVERRLAALFSVKSKTFTSEVPVWPDDLYPYRIEIELQKIVPQSERLALSEPRLQEALFRFHTRGYATAIVLNVRPLSSGPATMVLDFFTHAADWPDYNPSTILEQLADEFEDANAILPEQLDTRNEENLHSEIQYYLADMGQILSYSVWIPENDRNRSFRNKRLDTLSSTEFPVRGLAPDVARIARNIDVVWARRRKPLKLFEVEKSTTIDSGLLRMSNLISAFDFEVEAEMYICADSRRYDEAKRKANWPTFANLDPPLTKRCRFIAFEKLREFYEDLSILKEKYGSKAITMTEDALDLVSQSLVEY
jgi:hypothetical protein